MPCPLTESVGTPTESENEMQEKIQRSVGVALKRDQNETVMGVRFKE
jgi:hypothetical protein